MDINDGQYGNSILNTKHIAWKENMLACQEVTNEACTTHISLSNISYEKRSINEKNF